jgi:hypothetical protein
VVYKHFPRWTGIEKLTGKKIKKKMMMMIIIRHSDLRIAGLTS